MTIALIAHDSKKELMVQFCTAYCRILSQHKLVATGTTGKLINAKPSEPNEMTLLRLCDVHNIPMATNIATAEVLIHGLERGDLDWRDIVHPQN